MKLQQANPPTNLTDFGWPVSRLNGPFIIGCEYWSSSSGSSYYGKVSYFNGTSWIFSSTLGTRVQYLQNSSSNYHYCHSNPNLLYSQSAFGLSVYLFGNKPDYPEIYGTPINTTMFTSCSSVDNGVNFSCQTPTKIGPTLFLQSAVASQINSDGTLANLWVGGNHASEGKKIFAGTSSGAQWTSNAPVGCEDNKTNICSATSVSNVPQLSKMQWIKNQEVWALATSGTVMRLTSSGWSQVSIPTLTTPAQKDHVFSAVYGNGDVVLLVGYRANTATQLHEPFVVAYNRLLDKWFAVQTAFTIGASDARKSYLRDVAGKDLDHLYLVGLYKDPAGSTANGLILYRQ